jgi:subfamily B ATP-binding cassette protein MsbA
LKWTLRGSIERTFALALKRIKLSATFGPIASFMGFAVVIAVFWFGGMQVLNGTLTAGQLTMFLILTLTIAGSIGSFSGLWTSLQEALGATKRIFEILDTPSDIVDRPEAKALPRIAGHIVLDNVSFAYKDNSDQHVLRGVSLEVKPGEVLALVGPSGAGKTTLVNLIPRFFDPNSGAHDGQDIRSVQVKPLRSRSASPHTRFSAAPCAEYPVRQARANEDERSQPRAATPTNSSRVTKGYGNHRWRTA